MKINELLKDCGLNPYLYNLNLTISESHLEQFHGVKYICMHGSHERAKDFAKKVADKFLSVDKRFFEPVNLTHTTTFHCYRVNKVLSVSHGMGNASILTLLHDITKMMYFAGNHDVEYMRIGTSGGLGIDPGSVVLTETAYMPNLIPGFRLFPLGKEVVYPTNMDKDLNSRIIASQPKSPGFNLLLGNSIAADDFYLSQARFDGLIKPRYTEEERQEYFAQICKLNILNFEMESTALSAFCNRAEIPATMIAVTLLNRMLGDQIDGNKVANYSDRSQLVMLNYLASQLN